MNAIKSQDFQWLESLPLILDAYTMHAEEEAVWLSAGQTSAGAAQLKMSSKDCRIIDLANKPTIAR
ncbi:MAG: hypothetical protein KGI37_07300 [Alphaproteobacteria bacterium]|nr:hypothetical protein [Alphaproteobacteria bacterium]